MPCMCGATDCPSCGPAQGYEVVRVFAGGRWVYRNPEPEEDPADDDDDEGDEPCDS